MEIESEEGHIRYCFKVSVKNKILKLKPCLNQNLKSSQLGTHCDKERTFHSKQRVTVDRYTSSILTSHSTTNSLNTVAVLSKKEALSVTSQSHENVFLVYDRN